MNLVRRENALVLARSPLTLRIWLAAPRHKVGSGPPRDLLAISSTSQTCTLPCSSTTITGGRHRISALDAWRLVAFGGFGKTRHLSALPFLSRPRQRLLESYSHVDETITGILVRKAISAPPIYLYFSR